MNQGGVETGAHMHVLRHIDRESYQMDFLVQSEVSCVYDEEIRSLAVELSPALGIKRPWVFCPQLRPRLA